MKVREAAVQVVSVTAEVERSSGVLVFWFFLAVVVLLMICPLSLCVFEGF